MKISKRQTKLGPRWVYDSGEKGGQKRVLREFHTRGEAQDFVTKLNTPSSDVLEGLSAIERSELATAVALAKEKQTTVLAAVRAYAPPSASVAVRVAVSRFIAAKEASGRRGAYLAQLKVILGLMSAGRADQLVSSITPDALRSVLDRDKYRPATLQGMRRKIATFFAWCLRHKLVATDPMEQVDGVTVPYSVPRVFTVDESERLLRAAEAGDRGLIPWLALGLFCGIRPEEIRRLTWEAVKVDRGFVEVSGEASKVRSRRLVRLSENAVEWLRLGGELPAKNHRKRGYALRAAAGLTDWPADVLRHTAASMMLARDEDAPKVALQLGNSPEILFRHYRELVTREDAERFWEIRPARSGPERPEAPQEKPCAEAGRSSEQG